MRRLGAMPTALRGHVRATESSRTDKQGKRFPVQRQRTTPEASVLSGTGPWPIFRILAKSAADGIVVDVVDFLVHRGRLDNVSIIAATSLPKAIMGYFVGLSILHPGQKGWSVSPHI